MKRALGILLVFLAGFAAGVLCLQPPAPADAGAAGLEPSSGDANGDGEISIADAVHLLNFLFLGGKPPSRVNCPDVECPELTGAATVVLVRHAEREPGGCDAVLRPEGEFRARELARVLGSASVQSLVASNCIRTRLTLEPLQDALEARGDAVEIVEIPGETDVKTHIEGLPTGSTAVVAHHSFTLHDIMVELGLPESVREIPISGENYDNLFIVERRAEGPPRLVHLKYAPFPE